MRVCFLGGTHAAHTMAEAARRRGMTVADDMTSCDLVFVSMDTPVGPDGRRDTTPIKALMRDILKLKRSQFVLTSQVPPGFTRSLNDGRIYHQSETLRIEDAIQRAMYPEMLIVGTQLRLPICNPYREYLESFDCPILQGTYEDAEFAKIAINMTLAAQVESATRLSKAAGYYGADWGFVQRVLRHDSRIGKYSYLTPGDWRKSSHLLRDAMTLEDAKL
jgi:UDP-glucose 6-dehydrogenase